MKRGNELFELGEKMRITWLKETSSSPDFFARVEAMCERMHSHLNPVKDEMRPSNETNKNNTKKHQTQPAQRGARFVPRVGCVSQWRRVKPGERRGNEFSCALFSVFFDKIPREEDALNEK